MLENDDVVSVQRNLMAGKYAKVLSDLRRLGRPIKQSWLKSPSSNNTEKYKFTLNPVFKQFLVEEIESLKFLKLLKYLHLIVIQRFLYLLINLKINYHD